MNTKCKLLVTGAQGFVAGSVLGQATNAWKMHAVSRSAAPAGIMHLRWHTADALQPKALEQIFCSIQPDAIIHTAAVADIDFCQKNPKQAWAVNVDLTRNLAALCKSSGTRLVFCSTDTIFDGEHAPYAEDDSPCALNVYAETKIEAEQIVSALGPLGVNARLALVVGLPLMGVGNSFLARLVASFKAGQSVGVTEREVRTPVDVITAGKALLELAGGQHQGAFHLAGLTRVNRLALNRIIATRFGFSLDLVRTQTSDPARAPRPRDVSLSIDRTRNELQTPMLTLEDGLSLILSRTCTRV
jgi:dTDP-4-dehydrorhamnose reductase